MFIAALIWSFLTIIAPLTVFKLDENKNWVYWSSLVELSKKYDFKLIRNFWRLDDKCDVALKANWRSKKLRKVRKLYPDDPLLLEAEKFIALCYRFKLGKGGLPQFNDTINYKDY